MVNTNKKVFETVKVFVFKLSRLSEVERDLKTVERGKLLVCHYHAHKYCCDKVVIGQKNLKLLAVAGKILKCTFILSLFFIPTVNVPDTAIP